MSENKMSEIIRATVEGLKSSFDANTIIGEAITTANGTVVIPVSKLSVGFASGGIDYMGKKAAVTSSNNFGGGGGSGLSVVPVAFLIISPTGSVELLNINDTKEPADPVSQIINAIERSPELIEKFKEVFSKNK